ncbi:MAG: hypothetical protein HY543_00885 [Deltaproteobacteria bacterium]|nr:hypothetical protein [Deltaproteobacteria bacterium]
MTSAEFSKRTEDCLRNAGIEFISDLCRKSEADLLSIKNFGRRSLKEVQELLAEMDLSLGMRLDGFRRLE